MARMARVVVPHYPHHVTQRGNRRQRTFFRESDYRHYLELIASHCKRAGTEIWAYCLIPNHVHLVMVPTVEDGLRAALGEAHRHYTRYINKREGWRGHLWQERFYSCPMDENHLLAAVRYVERNPVVAGICKSPAEWKWSSARAHIERRDDLLVRVQPMLNRVDDWQSYLSSGNEPEEDRRIERHGRTGRPLGDITFLRKLERITGVPLIPKRPGRKTIAAN